MFAVQSIPVTFRAKKYLVGDIIDWFGKDIDFFDGTDEEVSVRVTVNENAMRLWALQYALHVKVLTPQKLCDSIKEDLQKAVENYR